MIRVVFTVALAVALLGVAMPAMEAGQAERTATHLDGVSERIERTARTLLSVEDPTPPSVPGARRTVRFRLRGESWSSASTAYLAVGGSPGGHAASNVVTYRVAGDQPVQIRLSGIDVRTPNGPVVFRGAGRHRLTMTLVRDGGVAVVVTRG